MENRHNQSQESLLSILSYEPETGKLQWKHRPRSFFKADHEFSRWNTRYSGEEAMTARIDGYAMGTVFGKPMKAHRVIFCMVYGFWPEYVDHINGIRHDNRLSNLRASTKVENGKNQKLFSSNKSGYVGVNWYKRGKKWRAFIGINRKRVYLGQFDTKEEAVIARELASKEHGFSERHGCP